MGLFGLLLFTVALAVFVGAAEDDLERDGLFCTKCGTELLECDDCCIICGTPSPYSGNSDEYDQMRFGNYCPLYEENGVDYHFPEFDVAFCNFCDHAGNCEYCCLDRKLEVVK